MSNEKPTFADKNTGSGNERIFLVVLDDSDEMSVALRFASRRAKKTGGRVALLYVVEPSDFQHWVSVGNLMQEEAREEAEAVLQKHAATANELSGIIPILYLREGDRREQLLSLLDEEPTISILVLAANTEGKGPGPLVTALSSKFVDRLHIPLTLVPGNLSNEDIDAIT
jgi:nucleotide-binding universal stress UspA family protein